jgi:hypothetical protein
MREIDRISGGISYTGSSAGLKIELPWTESTMEILGSDGEGLHMIGTHWLSFDEYRRKQWEHDARELIFSDVCSSRPREESCTRIIYDSSIENHISNELAIRDTIEYTWSDESVERLYSTIESDTIAPSREVYPPSSREIERSGKCRCHRREHRR